MQFPFANQNDDEQGNIKLGVTNDLGNLTKQMLEKFKVKSNKNVNKHKTQKMDQATLKLYLS